MPDYRTLILRTLLRSPEPLTSQEVSNQIHLSRQTTLSNLQKLVKEGVVLYADYQFRVQAYLQDTGFVNSFWVAFTPYIKTIQEQSDLSQAQNGDYVFSNFIALLELFKTKVRELQSQAHKLRR